MVSLARGHVAGARMRRLVNDIALSLLLWGSLVAGTAALLLPAFFRFSPSMLAYASVCWAFALTLWIQKRGLQNSLGHRLLYLPLVAMYVAFLWLRYQ